MSNKIVLLPDPVANQIAAGEVIQRPASVVKELMENAIDAGASEIKLIIEDAGKTKIQVIDNGCGMNQIDARMCFERHATSKIKSADDLFQLATKGFRGEALASIAAIAHVELKTKQESDDVGYCIEIEGSSVVCEEEFAGVTGTSFSVKNLFYNVPARRKFLKSSSVEMKHIIEEFQRVALPHPNISFFLISNDTEVYNLPAGTLKRRIVDVMGKNYDEKIVPVEEDTSIVKITGFVGKPEFAKKTRGEQYFFVNDRFIKSNYLQHAVTSSYEGLLPDKSYPSFFLFMELDPTTVDVNIHPTKTEIKFEEEKSIYAIIRSSVKQALGKYNVAPTLDFDRETSFDHVPKLSDQDPVNPPEIKVDPNYNPFQSSRSSGGGSSQSFNSSAIRSGRVDESWEDFFEGLEERGEIIEEETPSETLFEEENDRSKFFQVQGGFVITQLKEGMCIIDQHHAHERILYEDFKKSISNQKAATQQMLFPENMDLNPEDFILFKEMMEQLNQVGFDLREFGRNTIAIYGAPADLHNENIKEVLEKLIDEMKASGSNSELEFNDKLALKLAHLSAISRSKTLEDTEMESLVARLFQCETPMYAPNGKPTMIKHEVKDLKKLFQH